MTLTSGKGWIALLATVGLAACGGKAAPGNKPPAPLTCAVFQGDNCVKDAIQSAIPCLPSYTVWGKFSADWSRCLYQSGVEIDFSPPLPQPDHLAMYNFVEKDRGGATCLEIHNSDTDWILTTPLGTVTDHVEGNTETLTCPDGSRYQGQAEVIAGCGESAILSPRNYTTPTGASVAFVEFSNPIIAFQCDQDPP